MLILIEALISLLVLSIVAQYIILVVGLLVKGFKNKEQVKKWVIPWPISFIISSIEAYEKLGDKK